MRSCNSVIMFSVYLMTDTGGQCLQAPGKQVRYTATLVVRIYTRRFLDNQCIL